MQVQASDSNRQFDSGAVRGEDAGRGKPHLLPFAALACIIKDGFGNACDAPWGGIIELSKLYEAGSLKYPDRNWERGMPLSCFVDSALRHFRKFLRGDKDEPHLVQYCWNLCGLLQTHMWVADATLPSSLSAGLPKVATQKALGNRIMVHGTTFANALDSSFTHLSDYVVGRGLEHLVCACGYSLAALEMKCDTRPIAGTR